MSDLMSMMQEDVSNPLTSVEKVDQGGLKSVADLAKTIREKEELLKTLEQQLKEEKKNLLKLTDEEMPSLLAELGISSFELDDGSKIVVKQTYGASILVDNRPKAYEWLREHGYDDIIKNTVLCQFGRGEDDMAAKFKDLATQQGLVPNQKEEIHPQTLRAFVKERVEEGDEFPMELFGAYVGQRATVKRGK